MSKTRFTPSLALGVRLRARQLTQLVKYRVSSPRRNEAEQAARALPVAENYLDFALRTEVPADLAPLDPTLRELEVPRAEPLEARLEPDALPHQVEI